MLVHVETIKIVWIPNKQPIVKQNGKSTNQQINKSKHAQKYYKPRLQFIVACLDRFNLFSPCSLQCKQYNVMLARLVNQALEFYQNEKKQNKNYTITILLIQYYTCTKFSRWALCACISCCAKFSKLALYACICCWQRNSNSFNC